MCLIFTCGEHTFRKQVEGYENVTCQCHNCGNYSGHVIKSNPWFTFCFVVSPVQSLPLHLFPPTIYAISTYIPHKKEALTNDNPEHLYSPSSRSPSTATKTSPATSATSPSLWNPGPMCRA
ncbi:hypothetical protein F4779DRAFT_590438 [Xylariaceae sp. FL0662B]|nr:hypothetical protein F4779DRAFT_590438 [Xylariaceae sp. FL0662B]